MKEIEVRPGPRAYGLHDQSARFGLSRVCFHHDTSTGMLEDIIVFCHKNVKYIDKFVSTALLSAFRVHINLIHINKLYMCHQSLSHQLDSLTLIKNRKTELHWLLKVTEGSVCPSNYQTPAARR